MASADERVDLTSLPNLLCHVRLALTIPLLLFIATHQWGAALVVFALAGVSDWADGYFARKLGLVTSFGRGYDPLVDKVLTGGALIFLLELRDTGLPGDAGLAAWMVTAVLAREFIVTFLRSTLEQLGIPFGADRFGKIKMVLQCASIAWLLSSLAILVPAGYGELAVRVRDPLNQAMVWVTIASGLVYLGKGLPALARR